MKKKYMKYLLFVCVMALQSFLVIASGLSSARKTIARKTIVPAMQSGIRALHSQIAMVQGSNISVPVNSNQIFKSMVLQKVDAQSSQDSYNKLLYAALLVAGSAMITGSQQVYADDEKESAKQSLYDWLVSSVKAMIFSSQTKNSSMLVNNEQAVEEPLNINVIDPIKYPNVVKFFNKYRCSDELETRVQRMLWFEKNNEMLNDAGNDCGLEYDLIFDTNPVLKKGGFFNSKSLDGLHGFTIGSGDLFDALASGFLLKGPEIDRIINAERMKKYIEINNLDCLRIADKCISMNSDLLCVVSKEINFGDQEQKISSREIQQLAQIAYAGYGDWRFGSNVIRDIDSKLVFVDTEDISFGCFNYSKQENIRHLSLYAIYLSKEAQEWIDNEITCLENSDEGSENEIRLSHNSKYDTDIGIDFEKVKEEFNEIKRLKRLIEEREYKKNCRKEHVR